MYFGWLFAEEVSVIEAEVTGPLVMMVSELVGLEVEEVQCRNQLDTLVCWWHDHDYYFDNYESFL